MTATGRVAAGTGQTKAVGKLCLRALQVKEAEGNWMVKMGAARRAQARALFSSQTLLQRGSQQQIQGWSLHTDTPGYETSPERWVCGRGMWGQPALGCGELDGYSVD